MSADPELPAGDVTSLTTARWVIDALDDLNVCFYVKDAEGRYLAANAATAAVFGCQIDEVIGHTDRDLMPAVAAAAVRAVDRQVLAGAPVRMEERLPGPDGEIRHFLTRKVPLLDRWGHIYAIAGTSTDLTAATAARDALNESEARFQALFEHAPIGKAVVALDGTWLQVNPAMSRLTGYSEKELLTGRFHDITHPDDLDADLALMGELIRGARDHYDLDKRYIRADGTELWARISVALVRNEDGSPRYFISQIRDITERINAQRQLEEALRESERANAALRRADDLKEHLLAVTSHELRTPLTSILGFAQTLDDRWDSIAEPDKRLAMTAIRRQAQRLNRMIDDLLLLSLHQAGELLWRPAQVQLANVTDDAVARFPGLAVSPAPDEVALVDPQGLSKVLDRLIENAYQHGAPPVSLNVTSDAEWVTFCVDDEGPGVPEEFAANLFDMFTQADTGPRRQTTGAGLGLAVVCLLVEQGGGKVWHEPRPRGARFCVKLPRGGSTAST
jgi:PAS domain S-box-containing protein